MDRSLQGGFHVVLTQNIAVQFHFSSQTSRISQDLVDSHFSFFFFRILRPENGRYLDRPRDG